MLLTLLALTVNPAMGYTEDYSPGLGDIIDGVHFTCWFGHLGVDGTNLWMDYEEALDMVRELHNFTNGTHLIPYIIGQDVLRIGTTPDLIEDITPPGSGYARYKKKINTGQNGFLEKCVHLC